MSMQPSPTSYVHFHESRCTGCAACLRVCPTKAIRIRNHRLIRIVTQCIGCGACIQVCQAGAVSAATTPIDDIGRGAVAIALVSPVLYAQFPGFLPGAVLNGLRQMGFHHTVDMSFFLEMFNFAAEEFIRRNRTHASAPWPLISPVCPVVVRLIAHRFPSLLSHVLPVLRPAALMAREVRERIIPHYAGKGVSATLYYLNPCPTMREPPASHAPDVPMAEASIGINAIYPELKRRIESTVGSGLTSFSEAHFDFEICSTANAALGAMSGGEIANMDIEKALAVHGLEETIVYLNKIEMGRLNDIEYIELRTCREGCIGGVLTAADKYIAKRNLQRMVRVFGLGRRLTGDTLLHLYEQGRFKPDNIPAALITLFGARRSALSLQDLERIEKILEVIAGRDCGACGAPDCLTFAEDIVRGEADLNDCIWLQARRIRQGGAGPASGSDV